MKDKKGKHKLVENDEAYTKHTFHCECLKEWLKVKFICPICRTNINDLYSEKVQNVKEKLIPEDINDLYAEDIKYLMDNIGGEINNRMERLENEENANRLNDFFEMSSHIQSSVSEEYKEDNRVFERNNAEESYSNSNSNANANANANANHNDEIEIQHNQQRGDASSHDDYSHDLLARRNIGQESSNNDIDVSSILRSGRANNNQDLSVHDV